MPINGKAFFMLLFFSFFFLSASPMQAQVGLSIQTALNKIVPVNNDPVLLEKENLDLVAPLPLAPSPLLQQNIPSSYEYENLGIFCKFEVQLENKLKLPMKVRLGEVQYTEQLEYGPRN